MSRKSDPLSTLLLLGGVALAVVVAFALPALHVRASSKALLGIPAWEAVPWATTLKLLFLLGAVAVAFLPRLAALRAPVTAAAVAMMFVPAIAALTAGTNAWSSVRAGLAERAGTQVAWVDPGWGIVVLLVAALMVVGSLLRGRAEADAATAHG